MHHIQEELSQKRNVTPMSNIQQQIVTVVYKLVQHNLHKRLIALCKSHFIFVNSLCSVVIVVVNTIHTLSAEGVVQPRLFMFPRQ